MKKTIKKRHKNKKQYCLFQHILYVQYVVYGKCNKRIGLNKDVC
jgi:hypothetical protein